MIKLDMRSSDIAKYKQEIEFKEREISNIRKDIEQIQHELAIVNLTNHINKLKRIQNVPEGLKPYEVKIYVEELGEEWNGETSLEFEFKVVNKYSEEIKKLSIDFYSFVIFNVEHCVLKTLMNKEFSIYLETDNIPLKLAQSILGHEGENWYQEKKSMLLSEKLHQELPQKVKEKVKKV